LKLYWGWRRANDTWKESIENEQVFFCEVLDVLLVSNLRNA
jgi:hypothetical protein